MMTIITLQEANPNKSEPTEVYYPIFQYQINKFPQHHEGITSPNKSYTPNMQANEISHLIIEQQQDELNLDPAIREQAHIYTRSPPQHMHGQIDRTNKLACP